MKRQSDIAISAIMNDEKLMKSMMEIEKVAKEREEIRLQYMRQVVIVDVLFGLLIPVHMRKVVDDCTMQFCVKC